MKNLINIAVVGLGQVGIYLLNELNTKKKDIELKTGKKINVVAVSARSISKKRRYKVNKNNFIKHPLEIFNNTHVDILFAARGWSDGISKKVVETALKNRIHVITTNK
jgi:homoserine dehydrogenase